MALSELSKATCWFYPTQDRTLLSWERGLGFTHAGQRLDWPLRSRRFKPLATWGRFRVECLAKTSLVVEDCQTLLAASSAES